MKAILLDPANRSVTEVQVDNHYKAFNNAIHADTGDIVRIRHPETDKPGVDLWVDDNGLLVNPNPHGYFAWCEAPHDPYPLAGCGLVLGSTDDGETVDCPWSVAQVAACVGFIPMDKAKAWGEMLSP